MASARTSGGMVASRSNDTGRPLPRQFLGGRPPPSTLGDMFRAVALCLGLFSLEVAAVETVRISMGEAAGGSVTLGGKRLSFGPDNEDAHFTALDASRVVVEAVDGKLQLNG